MRLLRCAAISSLWVTLLLGRPAAAHAQTARGRQRPTSAPAMVLGSAAGFAGGFLVGAVAHTGRPSATRRAVDDGLVAGVLIGAPLGAFVAWLTSRGRPIYERVELWDVLPSVVSSPADGVGLGITIIAP